MTNATLRKGDKSEKVKDLQRLLKLFGYHSGAIDGDFGSVTEKSVKQYQTRNKLSADGVVGAKTWTSLDGKLENQPTIRRNTKGNAVLVAQSLLTNLGYNLGAIDGKFGVATENAVREYQRANKLTADGIVGAKTWASFASAKPKSASKEPVYYSQSDARWNRVMYSGHGDSRQTIGSSGCGTTCGAMIVATWCEAGVTPIQTSKDAIANGFRTYNNGTAWSYWPWLAKRYGLKFEQTSVTDKAVRAIKDGALVVASMGKGYFTNGGHYILLWDVVGNNIICHDPAKKTRDRATISLFKKENKQYFIFKR